MRKPAQSSFDAFAPPEAPLMNGLTASTPSCDCCEECTEQLLALLAAIGDAVVPTEDMRLCPVLAAWLEERERSSCCIQ